MAKQTNTERKYPDGIVNENNKIENNNTNTKRKIF